ncbi:hypothetical protein QYF61_016526 [Mycteria americana]|uniref:Uncharacterized protein n=1 Tax=Mycteria americana TaxID=33587 RepID=A0AAN7S023_MYCAM|nr:hypothetical protein QYF61_016526 [Mycteria americana]
MIQNLEEWLLHKRVLLPLSVLSRLEKWRNRNLMKFSKGKCKLLPLGRNNPRHQYTLVANQLESSFAEKAPGVLVVTKLTVNAPSLEVFKVRLYGALSNLI